MRLGNTVQPTIVVIKPYRVVMINKLCAPVLRRRRMAEIPAFVRKWVARSESPFSVTTTSGLYLAICEHTPSIHSSSSRSSVALEQHDRNP